MVRKQQDQSPGVEPDADFDRGDGISTSENTALESDIFPPDREEGSAINQDVIRLGGPTGGDFRGGGGPAIGEKHPADNTTADHYGSREETNAALEDKIALQNTRTLHDRL